MNIFCQAESILPQNGDMAVWNAETMRWEFQAAGGGSGQGGYAVGEWKDWHERTAPMGWKVRDGQVLTGASAHYPGLLAHLERPENAWKLKTEAEWQSLREAAGGVGGAWFYVLDKASDTIRLPDTRGDFMRDAGGRKGESANDGVYGVGEWHGDAIRNITGRAWNKQSYTNKSIPACGIADEFEGGLARATTTTTGAVTTNSSSPANTRFGIKLDASRCVPTAHENRPRAGMLLGCVYVGR